MADKSSFEFFPKNTVIKIHEAYYFLMFFGIFGGHQFYLGNKKRAMYLLITCGFSNLLLFFAAKLLPLLSLVMPFKLALSLLFIGYLFGGPVLVWDFITLITQVRERKGQVDPM